MIVSLARRNVVVSPVHDAVLREALFAKETLTPDSLSLARSPATAPRFRKRRSNNAAVDEGWRQIFPDRGASFDRTECPLQLA